MTTDIGANVEPAARQRSIIWIFVTLMITMLIASLSQMVFATALPTVVGELDGVEHMTWVITGYLLASTIMMPVYGKISDLLGRKPVLVAAILMFICGSVLGGLAESMTALIIGRTVQGLGGGGLIILSQAAIADVVPARERGKYVGIMGGVFAVSSVAGPLLGGWLTEGPGWRWAFWLNVPLGAIALVAVLVLLHLPKRPRAGMPSIDFVGMAVLAAGTAMLVLIGTWGGSIYAWGSPQILGLIVGSVLAIAVFLLVERRVREPIMPLAMFRERNFVLTTVAAMLTSMVMFGVMGYIPTYFQMVEGIGATKAGLLMTPMMVSMMIASTIVGNIVTRTGRYKLIPIVGLFVLAAGAGLLASTTVETPVVQMCISLGIMGTGLGMSMQILILVVQNSFPHQMVGTATAGNNYFRQVGASLGSALVGSIFAARLTTLVSERVPRGADSPHDASSFTPELVGGLPDALRIPVIESYNDALIPIFIFMAPLAVIAAITLCFIKEKPLANEIENEVMATSFGEGEFATFDAPLVDTTADERVEPEK